MADLRACVLCGRAQVERPATHCLDCRALLKRAARRMGRQIRGFTIRRPKAEALAK